MGVGADDHIHAVFLHQGHNLLLGLTDLIVVHAAPVEHGHRQIRLFRRHILKDAGNALFVDDFVGGLVVLIQKVHALLAALRHTHTAHALGKGHKGNLDALHIADGVALGLAEVPNGGVGPQRLHARVADGIQGGIQADEAILDGIGVRHLDQVHTGILQVGQQLHRSGGRFGAIGLPAEVALHIHNRHIGGSQLRGHIPEGPGIIVARRHNTRVHGGVGHIQVTHGPDVDFGNGILDHTAGGGFRCLGGGLGGGIHSGYRLAVRRLMGHAVNGNNAAGKDRHCQDQQENHPALGPFHLFSGLFPLLTAAVHFVIVQRHPGFPPFYFTLL